jgi:hypothetical protein
MAVGPPGAAAFEMDAAHADVDRAGMVADGEGGLSRKGSHAELEQAGGDPEAEELMGHPAGSLVLSIHAVMLSEGHMRLAQAKWRSLAGGSG